MGYTHYWTPKRNVSKATWDIFRAGVAKIIEASDVPVCWECDEPKKPPQICEEVVRFNGVGEDGHETFLFVKEGQWAFCKTVRKPYDEIVVACLILAEHLKICEWSSDGEHGTDKPVYRKEGEALLKKAGITLK